jgi:hypothetical protein
MHFGEGRGLSARAQAEAQGNKPGRQKEYGKAGPFERRTREFKCIPCALDYAVERHTVGRADILLTSRTGTAQDYLPGNDSRIRGRRMFAALELVFLLSDINQSLPTWNAQKTWDELRTFLGGGKGFWSESCV